MPLQPIENVAQANDKYRAQLRSTWVASPADTSLLVDSVPENVPTIVTVGWNTDLETVFRVEGKSGDNASNYALTGVEVIKGAGTSQNLPDQTPVNCLNHEEFFNQYETAINSVIDEINDALEAVTQLTEVVALTDAAEVTLNAALGATFTLSAAGDREIQIPTNPRNGQRILIIHHASGAARTLSLETTGAGSFLFGENVDALSETESGKRDVIGCVYSGALSRWMVVAYDKGFSV
jgi:hypothetical protein